MREAVRYHTVISVHLGSRLLRRFAAGLPCWLSCGLSRRTHNWLFRWLTDGEKEGGDQNKFTDI